MGVCVCVCVYALEVSRMPAFVCFSAGFQWQISGQGNLSFSLSPDPCNTVPTTLQKRQQEKDARCSDDRRSFWKMIGKNIPREFQFHKEGLCSAGNGLYSQAGFFFYHLTDCWQVIVHSVYRTTLHERKHLLEELLWNRNLDQCLIVSWSPKNLNLTLSKSWIIKKNGFNSSSDVKLYKNEHLKIKHPSYLEVVQTETGWDPEECRCWCCRWAYIQVCRTGEESSQGVWLLHLEKERCCN